MYLKTEEVVSREEVVPKLKVLITTFYSDLKNGLIVYQK